jgi:hypothetical protein
VSLLCFVSVTAEVVGSYPPGPQDNPWFHETNYIGEDIAGQIQAEVASEIEGIIDYSEIGPSTGSHYNGPDIGDEGGSIRWGNDVLVMSHGLPTWGKLSTDQNQQNGDMYASLLVPHTGTDDTVYIYRSQDGGLTWQYFDFCYSSGAAGGISDQEILVGYDGTDAYIYTFLVYDGSSVSSGIWLKRYRPDGSANWIQIVQRGDTIANISVDRNIENPQHIFLAWLTTTQNIDMESSSDYGATWGNHRNVVNNSKDVSVCAGGGGYVYITFVLNDTIIVAARYTNNLVSPSLAYSFLETDDENEYTPSIAAARTTPASSQVAWVLYRNRNDLGNYSIRYSTTTDGGASWASGTPWPPTNNPHATWAMRYPYARVAYNDALVRVVASIPEAGYDSLIYAYSTTSAPTSWSGRGIFNDHNITGEFGARVNYSDDCSGGYLVYRQYASSNIWCDAFDFSGIDDATDNFVGINLSPNPSNGIATLSYSVKKEGNVRISVYNLAGRLIKNLLSENKKAGEYSLNIDNRDLPSGVYFIRVSSPDGVFTKSITVLR